MTAISRSSPSSSPDPDPLQSTESSIDATPVFSPSNTVEEAKSRFATALSSGVDKLIRLGHGRERASVKILNEITNGCSPDEDEIFKIMSSFGVSMDDATKASTVSSAFRRAVASKGSAVEAIDELTSRLCLAKLAHQNEPLRSSENALTNNKVAEIDPAGSLTTRPSTQNLIAVGNKSNNLRSPKASGDKQISHKGKKRTLSDKGKEICPNANTALEAKAADVEVNSKISKEDEKKAKDSSGRSKSVATAGSRGKRTSTLRVDEGQPVKRVRSTSTI